MVNQMAASTSKLVQLSDASEIRQRRIELAAALRIAAAMAGRPVALLASHGPIVTGKTIGQAFSWLYYLERAAELQVLAEARGQKLKLLSEDVIQATQQSWDGTGPSRPPFRGADGD